MPDKASLKAAYRFFDNDDIQAQQLLMQHVRQTQARAQGHGTVLAIQDTTTLDYRTHPQTEGLGPISDGGLGLLMHHTLVASPERLALGVIFQRAWARDPEQAGIKHRRHKRPIQDKESVKWLQGLEATNEFARDLGTRVVCVADREADVYDLFAAERLANVELLIRAAWNRRVDSPQQHLWPTVAASTPVGQAIVNLPRQGTTRPPRSCTLDLHACEVTLRPPKGRQAAGLAPIRIHALWAVERHPPPKADAVQWMLLSTIPIATLEQALESLDWYCARWTIEVWHKVLKSGCRIESLQLGSVARLMRALAVYSVLAWRLLYATMLSRTSPDVSASVLLEPEEWQALYCAVHRTPTPCSTPPSLRQAVHWIAQLGGFIGRKSDGEPGSQTLWQGLQALNQLTKMFLIMRPAPPGS
jgi:hypothetical protein